MKAIRTIAVLDATGAEVWAGSMHAFGKANGRDVVADVAEQFRKSLEVNGRHEPAFIGGGAAPEFTILLAEAA